MGLGTWSRKSTGETGHREKNRIQGGRDSQTNEKRQKRPRSGRELSKLTEDKGINLRSVGRNGSWSDVRKPGQKQTPLTKEKADSEREKGGM